MTVTCIRDQGDFPILVIPHDPLRSLSEENYITSKGGATIGGNMLQYQLTVGREYTVFSVLFFEQLVRYLDIWSLMMTTCPASSQATYFVFRAILSRSIGRQQITN